MCISQSSSAHKAVIMEKTADLIAVQITTIDTLHNHCKPQKVIAEKAGCSQSQHADVFRKGATTVAFFIKSLLNQRQHQKHLHCAKEKRDWTVAQLFKVLFSDESTFYITF